MKHLEELKSQAKIEMTKAPEAAAKPEPKADANRNSRPASRLSPRPSNWEPGSVLRSIAMRKTDQVLVLPMNF